MTHSVAISTKIVWPPAAPLRKTRVCAAFRAPGATPTTGPANRSTSARSPKARGPGSRSDSEPHAPTSTPRPHRARQPALGRHSLGARSPRTLFPVCPRRANAQALQTLLAAPGKIGSGTGNPRTLQPLLGLLAGLDLELVSALAGSAGSPAACGRGLKRDKATHRARRYLSPAACGRGLRLRAS